MIPGSNLLNLAMTVQGLQQVLYYRFISRTTNEIGIDESDYALPIVLTGSLQPVPRDRYEQLGLDFNRNYKTFYASYDIRDLRRDVSGDRIGFNGNLYECLSANPWYEIDGWLSILIVEVNEPAPVYGDRFFNDDSFSMRYFTDDSLANPYFGADLT